MVLLVAIAFTCVLTALSLQANRPFRYAERLPMQWSLSGTVNWSAPRRIALSFTPILAAIVLGVFVVLAASLQPRPGQEGMVLPALLFVGGTFVAAHVFHLWLIKRTLTQKDD